MRKNKLKELFKTGSDLEKLKCIKGSKSKGY